MANISPYVISLVLIVQLLLFWLLIVDAMNAVPVSKVRDSAAELDLNIF